MSDLDDLKNYAEKYAKDHPQQVKEGEQELEKKLLPGEAQGSQQDKDEADRDPAAS